MTSVGTNTQFRSGSKGCEFCIQRLKPAVFNAGRYLTTTLSSGRYYYPHFGNEGHEAQSGYKMGPVSRRQSWNLNPGSLTPESRSHQVLWGLIQPKPKPNEDPLPEDSGPCPDLVFSILKTTEKLQAQPRPQGAHLVHNSTS